MTDDKLIESLNKIADGLESMASSIAAIDITMNSMLGEHKALKLWCEIFIHEIPVLNCDCHVKNVDE